MLEKFKNVKSFRKKKKEEGVSAFKSHYMNLVKSGNISLQKLHKCLMWIHHVKLPSLLNLLGVTDFIHYIKYV